MKIDLDNRYQFKPWYIRLYRRARYQPLYFLLAVYYVIRNIFRRREGRESLGLIFTLHHTMWQIKAEWYYTFDDVDSVFKHIGVESDDMHTDEKADN